MNEWVSEGIHSRLKTTSSEVGRYKKLIVVDYFILNVYSST